jgi:ATP dependent DNA ligase-like protein
VPVIAEGGVSYNLTSRPLPGSASPTVVQYFVEQGVVRVGPRWTKPQLVAQIRFVEWTAENRMRHAAFLGLRLDKSAREVRQEPLQTADDRIQTQLRSFDTRIRVARAAVRIVVWLRAAARYACGRQKARSAVTAHVPLKSPQNAGRARL